MAAPSVSKRFAVGTGSLLPQKKHITTTAASKEVMEKEDITKRKLDELSNQFGKRPEFNRLMYNDDNVLMTLNVQLKNPKYKANVDVSMEGTTAICKYEVAVDGGETITGTATALSKKAARKSAARSILMNLEKPTIDELEEITKWMVAGQKSNIGAREEHVSKDFGPSGHVVTLRWRVGNDSFDGKGTSNALKLAELYAMQDLYCQTQKLAPQQHNITQVPLKPKDEIGNETHTIETFSSKAAKQIPIANELSKEDACQMNVMRHAVGTKMKVKQQEDMVSSFGGFSCTLTWTWTDSSGVVQKKTVTKKGTSKAMAKAAASKAMLVETGAIEPVTPQESSQATSIRNLIPMNIAKATQMAVPFLLTTNCSVWRLFLPQLMEAIVQRCDEQLLEPILDAIAQADVKMPTDIWESLLSLASTAVDEEFCRTILYGLKNLTLDPRHFLSTRALEYYKSQSWLLSLEFNAENCSNLASIQGRAGKEAISVLCELTKSQLPLLFLKGDITSEYQKNPLKEDDMVLLVPYSDNYQWGQGLLCLLSKHKHENSVLSVTCKVINSLKWESTDAILNNRKFGIFHVTSTITNKRMMQALLAITHRVLPLHAASNGYYYDKELQRILIETEEGSIKEGDMKNVTIRTNIPLTEAQAEACRCALSNPITLIQGPPGTGKTQVACAIIDCWRRLSREKILAVADSNVAADNLIEGLAQRGIKALRIGFGSESLLQEESLKDLSRYERYRSLRAAGLHKEANSMRMLMIVEAVKQHQVIIATCVGSGNDILAGCSFPYVIIDECAQSIEASNLIPIGKGCEQLVLIGDHKQLRPTIISTEAASQGLSISLLERLVSARVAPVHLLDVQRRMHPSISEFPNRHFYRGLVRDAIDEDSRKPVRGFRWPSKGYNVAFVDASAGAPNGHFETVVGTSKSNALEVDILLIILKSIIEAQDVKESQIGILTPYDAQKWQLRRRVNQMEAVNGPMIEIDSVDGFQGKEKELILFSAVRSNLQKDVGFLRDPRRMNVMLTRARRGLIIVADKYTIMNDNANWRPYVEYVTDRCIDIHISELNMFLDTTSPRLESIARRARTGSYP
ncbi:ATP-dependent helicase NAM7 [Babesia sp. Xinjiang]|uniref:ATP-dependent helicase NAM7 n=1 Tax=Babesia sp. Xinjiang TaxID=462227 RepID=UPI000A2309AA|nr:ATP-dependent helicase NAM7 [Babesia sp. Xinjiang]ORM42213.1 ATP-dependent helicase NAM7 [Babesia sp. Xinjiang]